METSFEGGQGPEGNRAPYVDGWMDGWMVPVFEYPQPTFSP